MPLPCDSARYPQTKKLFLIEQFYAKQAACDTPRRTVKRHGSADNKYFGSAATVEIRRPGDKVSKACLGSQFVALAPGPGSGPEHGLTPLGVNANRELES
jgi:hypothetical protein